MCMTTKTMKAVGEGGEYNACDVDNDNEGDEDGDNADNYYDDSGSLNGLKCLVGGPAKKHRPGQQMPRWLG